MFTPDGSGILFSRFDETRIRRAELGAATSLSRERGRRRAGALSMRLLEEAQKEGLKAVFVLGKDPRMERNFGALGFEEIDCAELPAEWQGGYDMSRPSRAFIKYLDNGGKTPDPE